MREILKVHQKPSVTHWMRILVEEKEIVVTIGAKISDLSASKDILDLKSLIFAVVKIKNFKNQSTSHLAWVSSLSRHQQVSHGFSSCLSVFDVFQELFISSIGTLFCFWWATQFLVYSSSIGLWGSLALWSGFGGPCQLTPLTVGFAWGRPSGCGFEDQGLKSTLSPKLTANLTF